MDDRPDYLTAPVEIDIPLTDVGRVLTDQRLEIELLKDSLRVARSIADNLRRDRAYLREALFDWEVRFSAATCEVCWGNGDPYDDPCEECWGTGRDSDPDHAASDAERSRVRMLESIVESQKATIRELQKAIVTGVAPTRGAWRDGEVA